MALPRETGMAEGGTGVLRALRGERRVTHPGLWVVELEQRTAEDPVEEVAMFMCETAYPAQVCCCGAYAIAWEV